MRKELISFAKVMKFFKNIKLKGGLTPKPPCVRPLFEVCYEYQ